MAESLARPWILKHLLGIAETRGANIHDAPPLKEKRKVQITRFLTFPSNDRPNDIIWALISDKQYEITAKFTASAVTAYNRENDVFGAAEDERRLTTRRFSLAILSDVKAFFARVPLGNGKGMTDTETIALEVGEIRILGADHEGIFGNPAHIETHEDLQEWILGLKQGGGGGNILKHAKEEITDAKTLPAQQQPVLASEKQVTVPEGARQPTANPKPEFNTSPGKGDRQVNLLKEWKRKWKTSNIIQFPPEVQPIFDQILVFGKEARQGDVQGEARFRKSNGGGADDIDQGELVRQEPTKSRPDGSQPYSVDARKNSILHTPASSRVCRTEDVGSQRSEPSTPSVWEDSEDERQRIKRKRREENEGASGSSPRALLPTPRHTRSPNSTSERDENPLERDKDDADDVTTFSEEREESEEDNNGDNDHSDRSEDEPNSLPAPTPAQRPKRSSDTIPSAPQGRDRPSELDVSQARDSYAQPRMPVSAFPYHATSKHAISSRNAQSNFETSRSESYAQSESQHRPPQISQSQHTADSSSQKLESNAPRILVPDSDTSGQSNSQSQSQSQSQPQSQSQSRHFLQSQPDSQSHLLTRPASTNSEVQQIHSLYGSMRSPLSTAAPRKQSAVPRNGEGRVPLLSSRSANQSQQKPQSSNGQANKNRVAGKMSSQNARLPNSVTESQAQSQSRSRDVGTTMTLDSALATPPEASSISTRGPLPQLGIAVQDQRQSLSTTQEDSQMSHTETSSFNSKKTTTADAQTIAKAELLAPLDADDARTHGLLFGKSDHAGKPEAIRRDEPKRSVRETYRLSHVQGSPTTRLGKHRRFSTSSLHSMASATATNEENVRAEKKMRVPTANSEAPIVHQEAAHDSMAWKAPTFLQRRKTEGAQNTRVRSEDNEQQARNVTANKDKGKQPAEAVFAHQDAAIAGQSHNSAQKSASASITKTSSLGSQNAGIPGRTAGESASSQAISSQTTTQTSTSSESKKRKRNTSQTISSAASSSQVKIEDTDDYYLDKGLLDGFTSNLTLHRTPGGPKWLNWDDALRILSRLNKRDFPSQ